MSKRLVIVTGLFLLIIAAGGNFSLTEISARRAIPWDCSNWAAYAHDDRTTAILETLAENRGKALYCGIDQSDTFTKAETWEAGRDRNERDDTIYWGERGNFRGFIAAQEGWLTEGESGITGQSIASIFEFPREERRRRWRTRIKKLEVLPDNSRRAKSDEFRTGSGALQTEAESRARNLWTACFVTRSSACSSNLGVEDWATWAGDEALAYCESQGYTKVRDVALGARVDWDDRIYTQGGQNHRDAYRVATWSATCTKTVRVRR